MDGKFVMERGRAGHYGMCGMHERAKLLGGELTVRSQLDSGTEVELSLPATNTYATPDSNTHS
jgi:signal transduction histidine kinase